MARWEYMSRFDGAIGCDDNHVQQQKEARLGSETLRVACLDLFQRTAKQKSISLGEAMDRHLGYHAPPKIVRSPHGTASAKRYLARAA